MKKLSFSLATLILMSSLSVKADSPVPPLPPDVKEARVQSINLSLEGDKLRQAKDLTAAAADYQSAMDLWAGNPLPYPGLAEVLRAEGKTAEALQVYKKLFYDLDFSASNVATDPLNLMNYALLLNETGHWQEAVFAYNKGLPLTNDADLLKSVDGFDPNVAAPLQLFAMAHLARGIEYGRYGDAKDAIAEYVQAKAKAPDSALVNYYYGFGWQRLDPKDRAKIATAQQAKAALQKAIKVGNAHVKKAAQQALKTAG